MKVGIIGAGNVATHLVKGLLKAGISIPVIYSRTLASAQRLAAHSPETIATDSANFTEQAAAEVYLLAIPDQALPELLQTATFPQGAVVAHTSGTQPIQQVASVPGIMAGVFYPLQTFSKEKEILWQQVPICVEASTKAAEEALLHLGEKLSNQVVLMEGVARRQLHVAAVFACNFTNHLWGVAHEVLQQAKLPPTLLEPLVQETVQKAFQFAPFTVQTGPAQRRDTGTIEAHLALLAAMPPYQHLYQVLTESIMAVSEKEPIFIKQP